MNKVILSNEISQALLRLILVTCIFLYALVYALIFQGEIFHGDTILLLTYIFIALVEYVAARHYSLLPEENIHRIAYRIFTNILDNSLLAVAMILLGHAGSPLFLIFLWITFGIGIRYGVKYFIMSAALNILSFSAVIYFSPYWHNKEVLLISLGLLFSLIILPMYVYSLVARLSEALTAEKSAKMVKQTLLANINHELRMPLGSIINVVDLIRSDGLPSSCYKLLNIIKISAKAQLQLINSILDLSKLESKEFALEIKKFDLYKLIYEVKLITLPHMLNSVNLNVFIDPKINPLFKGAHAQLRQILINLTGNAAKFTKHGFVELRVSLEADYGEKQNVRFDIRDSGIGIPENAKNEIYKPFVQANSTIVKNYGGTGIGVTISNELAKLMGGKIEIESELNKGTVATLSLPLYKEIFQATDIQNEKIQAILFIPDTNNEIVKYFEGFNIQIISFKEVMSQLDGEKTLQRNLCFIYDEDYLDSLPAVVLDTILEADVPKIALYKKTCKTKPLTAINLDTESEYIRNALFICNTFLNLSLYENITFPLTSKTLKILVVEDDPTLAKVYQILFSSVGHSVKVIENGEEGLNELKKGIYDIALLDDHLPGLSGHAIARKYSELNNNNKIPLILMQAEHENLRDGYEIYFSTILYKPFMPHELLNEICTLCGLIEEPQASAISINSEIGRLLNYSIIDSCITIAGANKYCSAVDIYDVEVIEILKNIKQKYWRHNKQVYSKLHQLTGASLSIGANKFGYTLKRMIANAKNRESRVLDESNLESLQNMHRQTVAGIKNYVSSNYKNVSANGE